MLRKVSKPDAANQRDAPLSPAMASQSSARVRPHQPNREMPWVDHDYESAPAAPFTPRVPAVLREFLRQENETLGFKNQGLLSTMKYLDFSDVTTETLDFFGEDDMGKLFDSPNEIDWVSPTSASVLVQIFWANFSFTIRTWLIPIYWTVTAVRRLPQRILWSSVLWTLNLSQILCRRHCICMISLGAR